MSISSLDEIRPGYGHNSGAPESDMLVDLLTPTRVREDIDRSARVIKFVSRKSELLSAFERWKEKTQETITDEDGARASTDFAAQLKREAKAMEGERTTVKAPFLAATRVVDGFFKDLTDPLLDAAKGIEKALTVYAREVEKARRAEAQAEADRLRVEAERAAEAARRVQSVEMIDNAIEHQKEAAQAQKVATAPAADLSRVRGDFGGVSSLRKGPWQIEVTDINLVPMNFLMIDEAKVKEAIRQLTDGKQTDDQIERAIDGLRLFRENVVSVR